MAESGGAARREPRGRLERVAATRLGAVVVTHHPRGDTVERLGRIAAQGERMIVVDNASSADVVAILRALARDDPRTLLLELDENAGLSTALNLGVRAAIAEGCTHVCTFDQDSEVYEDYASCMLSLLDRLPADRALIGCNFHDRHRGGTRFASGAVGSGRPRRRTTVIGSGMLFSTALYRHVGPFDESFFIDSVDHEYCLRARSLGCLVALHPKPLIGHRIGEAPSGVLRLDTLLAYRHSSARRYTIARNTLLTVRRHGRREPLWTLRQIVRLGCEALSIALFEDDRAAKMRSFLKGLRDGLAAARPDPEITT